MCIWQSACWAANLTQNARFFPTSQPMANPTRRPITKKNGPKKLSTRRSHPPNKLPINIPITLNTITILSASLYSFVAAAWITVGSKVAYSSSVSLGGLRLLSTSGAAGCSSTSGSESAPPNPRWEGQPLHTACLLELALFSSPHLIRRR